MCGISQNDNSLIFTEKTEIVLRSSTIQTVSSFILYRSWREQFKDYLFIFAQSVKKEKRFNCLFLMKHFPPRAECPLASLPHRSRHEKTSGSLTVAHFCLSRQPNWAWTWGTNSIDFLTTSVPISQSLCYEMLQTQVFLATGTTAHLNPNIQTRSAVMWRTPARLAFPFGLLQQDVASLISHALSQRMSLTINMWKCIVPEYIKQQNRTRLCLLL